MEKCKCTICGHVWWSRSNKPRCKCDSREVGTLPSLTGFHKWFKIVSTQAIGEIGFGTRLGFYRRYVEKTLGRKVTW